jgi:hypothetical protein
MTNEVVLDEVNERRTQFDGRNNKKKNIKLIAHIC